jgi:hypothetical protein
VRCCFRAVNLVLAIPWRGFRPFVRPAEAVLGAAWARGFETALDEHRLVWRIAALERR